MSIASYLLLGFLAMPHMVKLILSPAMGEMALCWQELSKTTACPFFIFAYFLPNTSMQPSSAVCKFAVKVSFLMCVLFDPSC